MKKRMFSAGILFSMIFITIMFFSSPAISAGPVDGERYSPRSGQNISIVTGEENTVSFMQHDGGYGIGYRCGTVPPSVEEAEAVERAREQNRTSAAAIPCIVVIPVAFHIVRYDDGVTGDVTDMQINDQMNVLNSSFASTGFQFSLHSIERVNNTAWSQQNTSADEINMKSALAVDPAFVFNVYTGNIGGGLLGWAYYPSSYPEDSYMHGIVVLYSSLPGGSAYPYNEGDTVTHEAGHYLGLYHTFRGGCTSPGDQVDDTPYEASAAYGCPAGRDTCVAAGLDPIYNFMDYSDDNCIDHFTVDQSTRIDSMVEIYKPSLINCVTGMPGILYDDTGMVWISALDMGTLISNEWEIIAKTDAAFTSPIAIGMRFYNPIWAEFSMTIMADDNWNAHSAVGTWTGSGSSAYYSISTGSQGTWTLTTTPPPRVEAAKEDGSK